MRFAEVDVQRVVFNSHYLLYCDEASSTFFAARELSDLAEQVRLVASKLVWTGSARLGDVVSVDVSCAGVGRTSFTLHFELTASGRDCCRVETTYVVTDPDGRPTPVPPDIRARLEAN